MFGPPGCIATMAKQRFQLYKNMGVKTYGEAVENFMGRLSLDEQSGVSLRACHEMICALEESGNRWSIGMQYIQVYQKVVTCLLSGNTTWV